MSSIRSGWWRLLAAALAIVALSLVVACDGEGEDEPAPEHGGSIEVVDARARFTTGDFGAVYFEVHAEGLEDTLVGASAGIAGDTQLHTVVSDGGTSSMQRVEGIPIDAGGHITLEPGGYHVMLLGVEEVPEVGSTFELVLEFERAGRVTVTVEVEAFGGGDASMDHGEMDHGDMEGEMDDDMDGEDGHGEDGHHE